MAKKKPTLVFNPSNLTFEQKKVNWSTRILYGLMVTSGFIVFAFISILLSHKFFPSPNEHRLIKQIAELKKNYATIERSLDYVSTDINTLRRRDENLYRVIYQREPIDENIWKSTEKTSEKYDIFKANSEYEIIGNVLKKLEIVKQKMKVQNKSYNELVNLVQKRDEMIKSIPSIQPITNKDLTRISSGFGWRIHPIYRIPKKHTGIDFTAPSGTPIFATGDGVVELCGGEGGYGNSVVINHGYGYKTRYAHMSKFNTSVGAKISRGDKIGFVGSTGASVGPHLHYEIEYHNEKVDPALFFFNDLNPDQFEEILKITNAGGKSFD